MPEHACRRIYLGIGSNLGDRKANIESALEMLDERFGKASRLLSSVVSSRSQGFEGPDFLNCVVSYESDRTPLEILRICKETEMAMGRPVLPPRFNPDGSRKYESRTIDIDVLMCGDETVNTPQLTIPHPKMRERDFVMGPLREIFDGNV